MVTKITTKELMSGEKEKNRLRSKDFDEDCAVELYKELGNCSKVAEIVGGSVYSVNELVRKKGLLGKSGAKIKLDVMISKEELEGMIKNGVPQWKIAKKLGVSQQGISKLIKRHNIKYSYKRNNIVDIWEIK